MVLWVEFSYRIASGVLYYGTPNETYGMMIMGMFWFRIVETMIQDENQLPQWLQSVWRGLSGLCSFLFMLRLSNWCSGLIFGSVGVVLKFCGIDF